ncbi:MAG: helix-turn-helix domain-containing protein [Pseudobdellovibrionaceae bacterium]
MNLHNQLKYYLKAYGLTASELSRRSNVPKQSISDWLAGVVPRSLSHLKSVATVFGLTIDELCYGDVSIKTDPYSPTSNEPASQNSSEEVWMTGYFEGKIRKINGVEFVKIMTPKIQPQLEEKATFSESEK